MANSDERREVAARLRDKYDERMRLSLCSFEPQDVYEQAYHYLSDLLDCLPDGKSAFTLLADLIDPTCHIVLRQSDSDFTDEPHYLCSRCGKEAVYVYERRDYTLAGIVSHARYCSYCGARVVSGNDAS